MVHQRRPAVKDGPQTTLEGAEMEAATHPDSIKRPRSKWWMPQTIMGLEPSPELLAISMGKPMLAMRSSFC